MGRLFLKKSLELHLTCDNAVLKIKSWLQMGLSSLELSDIMGITGRNVFVVFFFCLNVFIRYSFIYSSISWKF